MKQKEKRAIGHYFILSFLLMIISQNGFAQKNFYSQFTVFEDTLLKYEVDDQLESEVIKCMFIPSDFAKENVSNKAKLDSLFNSIVLRIDLAYTLYKSSKNFNQKELNESRWDKLNKGYPNLFSNSASIYFNYCQSQAITSDQAKELKHGFYIYYRPNEDSITREKEITNLESFILDLEKAEISKEKKEELKKVEVKAEKNSAKKKPKSTPKLKPKDPNACRVAFYGKDQNSLEKYFNDTLRFYPLLRKKSSITIQIMVNQYGTLTNYSIKDYRGNKFKNKIITGLVNSGSWNAAYYKKRFCKSKIELVITYSEVGGINVSQKTIFPKYIYSCGAINDDSLFVVPPVEKPNPILTIYPTTDETVYNVLKRIDTLHNTIMVIDVTGSMYPHIKTTLSILNDSLISNKTNLKAVVAFNDGDNKRDSKKISGNTGGVYYTENISVSSLGRFLVKAMKNGNGGDGPENNIEATLTGIKNCETCSDIVMIADNYATPRDYMFNDQIGRPIHWILCANGDFLNPDYLDLIRQNKGYGHTKLTDFSGLELMKNGEEIEIDGNIYVIQNGNFTLVKD